LGVSRNAEGEMEETCIESKRKLDLAPAVSGCYKDKLFRTYIRSLEHDYGVMANTTGVFDCFNAQTFLGAYENGTINPDIGGACVAISSTSGLIRDCRTISTSSLKTSSSTCYFVSNTLLSCNPPLFSNFVDKHSWLNGHPTTPTCQRQSFCSILKQSRSCSLHCSA
jgi:hypothetical protein